MARLHVVLFVYLPLIPWEQTPSFLLLGRITDSFADPGTEWKTLQNGCVGIFSICGCASGTYSQDLVTFACQLKHMNDSKGSAVQPECAHFCQGTTRVLLCYWHTACQWGNEVLSVLASCRAVRLCDKDRKESQYNSEIRLAPCSKRNLLFRTHAPLSLMVVRNREVELN